MNTEVQSHQPTSRKALDAALLGHRIRHFRLARGLTLRQLGEATGITVSQLSMVENARRGVQALALTRIADALGVDLSTLTTAEAPSERASLELELARLQDSDLVRSLGIPQLEPRRGLSDDVLRTVVALHRSIAQRDEEAKVTPEAARRAMIALRHEGQRVDNYYESIEDEAAALMATVEHGRGPITHHTVAQLAEHLGFRLVHADDLPSTTRTVTDLRGGTIYLPPASTPGGHGLRSLALQALAHRVLGHGEPGDYADFLRQRIEITAFAAACLLPRDTSVPFLREAKAGRDIALEDFRDTFGVTHETAAHRFTALATRFLDLPVHFLRVRRSGAIVKGYENDGIRFPTDAEGGIIGQVVCANWAARTAFNDSARAREHYQYTDSPTGTYWCSVQTGTADAEFSITLGVPFAHSQWFRGRETTERRSSTCPDPACCRRPDPADEQLWHESAWPSAKLGEHVLAPLPTGRFPGVDDGEVYAFLRRHSA